MDSVKMALILWSTINCAVSAMSYADTSPNGDTKIQVGDRVVIGSAKSTMASDLDIVEVDVDRDSVYANKTIAEIPRDEMARVLLIERGKDIIIPRGDTTVAVGDVLVMYRLNE